MIQAKELPTILGVDYGFAGGSYLGYGLPNRYCACINTDEDGTFFEAWFVLEPVDMDSTDFNPFRQYTIRADHLAHNAQTSHDPTLHALNVCWDVVQAMGYMSIPQLDRLLVTTLKMSRAI